ncbi:MAG: DUF4412 domain-containing protein [Verrucomicrobia bacterium]|nr:DUF4412 domain-containing protein [Verrucomicrobiota bacterium]
MKRSFSLVCALLILAAGARADYILKETVSTVSPNPAAANPPQTQTMTLKIKGFKCRIDATAQTSAIMDSNTGETVVLIHPQKAFMKVSRDQLLAQAKALKDMLGNQSENPEAVELKPTGKKETINGRQTEEYIYDLNGIRTTVDIDKDYPNYRDLVTALYNAQNGPGMDAFRTLALPPGKFPGMPVRTSVELMGEKMVTTIESVEQTELSDADFAVPAGYKEFQMNAASPGASRSVTPGK